MIKLEIFRFFFLKDFQTQNNISIFFMWSFYVKYKSQKCQFKKRNLILFFSSQYNLIGIYNLFLSSFSSVSKH